MSEFEFALMWAYTPTKYKYRVFEELRDKNVVVRKIKGKKSPVHFKFQGPLQYQSGFKTVQVDASYKNGDAGLGLIVRDESGEVIETYKKKVDGIQNSLKAEIETIVYGLKQAADIYPMIVIESDSKVAVDVINDENYLSLNNKNHYLLQSYASV
ncbi:hypothetical protein CFOL_v3_16014 [Cephalotus follicularis]|uniref:RNase H type-1 domain-containing protein n=1 Tax=Cephalotus follicularis TaxID=3775 RepID=A0A1Q3BX24_CEPFO|nr:hypothetical protein CFOL_v3_16014 [Cephalotus follicularis]